MYIRCSAYVLCPGGSLVEMFAGWYCTWVLDVFPVISTLCETVFRIFQLLTYCILKIEHSSK